MDEPSVPQRLAYQCYTAYGICEKYTLSKLYHCFSFDSFASLTWCFTCNSSQALSHAYVNAATHRSFLVCIRRAVASPAWVVKLRRFCAFAISLTQQSSPL